MTNILKNTEKRKFKACTFLMGLLIERMESINHIRIEKARNQLEF